MIRVFLADDHALFRSGVKLMLSSAGDIQVVGEAGDGRAVLRALEQEELKVDVLILDLSMPRLNGLETLDHVRVARPALPVLVVSMHSEELYARRVIAAGGAGYLSKGQSERDLVDAVRTVAAGRVFLSRSQSGASTERRPHQELSARELQIFMLLISGSPVTDIAAELDLSMSTVSTYIGRMRTKLGVQSVAEIVSYAHREGLID